MATTMIMGGDRALDLFHLYHAYSGEDVWEYLNRHGDTAMRIVDNIVRSRIARASHGKPTVDSLERTALRMLKRAGEDAIGGMS